MFHNGQRIKHVSKTDWGLGQILEEASGESVKVFFVNVGLKTIRVDYLLPVDGTEAQSAALDHLRIDSSQKLSKFRSLPELKEWFLRVFAEGFSDPDYLDRERNYKVEAHELCQHSLDRKTFDVLISKHQHDDVCRRALQVLNRTNLVYPNEKMALKDGLKKAADQVLFANSLAGLLYGEDILEQRFTHFASCLETIQAAKWTTMT